MNPSPKLTPRAAAGAEGWTDERVELVKKLWQEGLSASQIAKQLGGVSRNTVIGKVHRLGLAGRAMPSLPTRAARRQPKPAGRVNQQRIWAEQAKPKTAAPPALRSQPLPVETDQVGTATVLTLGAHMCKWPIGDPALPNFTLCGRRAEGSYCSEHAAIAYQPAEAKKKASASELARSLRRYL